MIANKASSVATYLVELKVSCLLYEFYEFIPFNIYYHT